MKKKFNERLFKINEARGIPKFPLYIDMNEYIDSQN